MPPKNIDTTISATRRTSVSPRDSRHERVSARGTVTYEDDRRVDFRADDGEVRVFMKDDWHIDWTQPTRTDGRRTAARRPEEDPVTTTDRMIPTLAMAQDPRLRRLFATVGFALADGALRDPDLEDAIESILLDLAPEYLPPDDWADHPDDASDEVRQWQEMVDAAIGRG